MGIISKAMLFLNKKSMGILLRESGHALVEFSLTPKHNLSTNPPQQIHDKHDGYVIAMIFRDIFISKSLRNL